MNARGFTLVELMASVAVSAILLASLGSTGLLISNVSERQSNHAILQQEADFAMQRMRLATTRSARLLIPLYDRPGTPLLENVREQSVPAEPPPVGSTLATAVLAVTQDRESDLDYNGTPDADNDADGLFDEDLPADSSNDGESGLIGLDDDGDGTVATGFLAIADDDELQILSEDPINGVDDDGDGNIDEDASADMNFDFQPGIAGVDDDGDGLFDEGSASDDDEDGSNDEDWFDAHAFYLNGSDLVERIPVPWDQNGDLDIDGADYVESTLTSNVQFFGVTVLGEAYDDAQLVELTLIIATSDDASIERTARLRVGSSL